MWDERFGCVFFISCNFLQVFSETWSSLCFKNILHAVGDIKRAEEHVDMKRSVVLIDRLGPYILSALLKKD